MSLQVTIPAVGESVTSGVISSWLKNDGDTVAKGDALFTLETDKVSTEITADGSGILRVKAAAGAEVKVGEVVATIEEHSVLGGLGGSVAEWLSDQITTSARLIRLGTADEFYHETGEQEHAHEHFDLVPERMAVRLLAALKQP